MVQPEAAVLTSAAPPLSAERSPSWEEGAFSWEPRILLHTRPAGARVGRLFSGYLRGCCLPFVSGVLSSRRQERVSQGSEAGAVEQFWDVKRRRGRGGERGAEGRRKARLSPYLRNRETGQAGSCRRLLSAPRRQQAAPHPRR